MSRFSALSRAMLPYGSKARQLAGRSLVAGISALSTAGSLISKATVAGANSLTSGSQDKEVVTSVSFDVLETVVDGTTSRCQVLVVLYEAGFQLWTLADSQDPQELVSRRDGPVRCDGWRREAGSGDTCLLPDTVQARRPRDTGSVGHHLRAMVSCA